MMHFFRVLLVHSCLLLFPGSTIRRSGPYNYVLEKIERCPDLETSESYFPTRLTKVSRNKAVLNDTFRISPQIDENTKAEVEIQEWGNQGFRPRAFQFTFNGCSKFWELGEPNLKKLFRSTGVNITGCPFPAGNYTSSNLEMDFKLSNIPVMMYNKYRMIVNLLYVKRRVGCVRFYGDVIPKE